MSRLFDFFRSYHTHAPVVLHSDSDSVDSCSHVPPRRRTALPRSSHRYPAMDQRRNSQVTHRRGHVYGQTGRKSDGRDVNLHSRSTSHSELQSNSVCSSSASSRSISMNSNSGMSRAHEKCARGNDHDVPHGALAGYEHMGDRVCGAVPTGLHHKPRVHASRTRHVPTCAPPDRHVNVHTFDDSDDAGTEEGWSRGRRKIHTTAHAERLRVDGHGRTGMHAAHARHPRVDAHTHAHGEAHRGRGDIAEPTTRRRMHVRRHGGAATDVGTSPSSAVPPPHPHPHSFAASSPLRTTCGWSPGVGGGAMVLYTRPWAQVARIETGARTYLPLTPIPRLAGVCAAAAPHASAMAAHAPSCRCTCAARVSSSASSSSSSSCVGGDSRDAMRSPRACPPRLAHHGAVGMVDDPCVMSCALGRAGAPMHKAHTLNILILGAAQTGKSTLVNLYRAAVTGHRRWPFAPTGMCGDDGTDSVDPYPDDVLCPSWLCIDTPGRLCEDGDTETGLLEKVVAGVPWHCVLGGPGRLSDEVVVGWGAEPAHAVHQCILVIPANDLIIEVAQNALQRLLPERWRERHFVAVQTVHEVLLYVRRRISVLRRIMSGAVPFVVVTKMDQLVHGSMGGVGIADAMAAHDYSLGLDDRCHEFGYAITCEEEGSRNDGQARTILAARCAVINVLRACVPVSHIYFSSARPHVTCDRERTMAGSEEAMSVRDTRDELIRLHQQICLSTHWRQQINDHPV